MKDQTQLTEQQLARAERVTELLSRDPTLSQAEAERLADKINASVTKFFKARKKESKASSDIFSKAGFDKRGEF